MGKVRGHARPNPRMSRHLRLPICSRRMRIVRNQTVDPRQIRPTPPFARLRPLPAALAVAAAGVLAPAARGVIVTNTSGVYDEQTTQTNVVDQTAASPTSGSVSLV